jgi:hypothetical protein
MEALMARTSFQSLARRHGLRVAALALVAALPLGCEGSSTEPELTIRVETLAKASVPTNDPARMREVVRDPARYEAVWRQLWGDREIARPTVNFQRDMVVVLTHSVDACLGEVAIERLERAGPGFIVKAGESPPHFCSCVSGETTFHVVRAPRVAGPIEFETHPIPGRCG